MRPFVIRRLLLTIGLTLPFLLVLCERFPEQVEEIIYHPPVVFVGLVNDDYDSLPGNLAWPNTCELLHDTLRMRFYSDTFHVTDNIWYGNHIMLTLLPNANDSIISTRSVFFHMARYLDMNYSYDVIPADSNYLFNNKAEMHAHALSRSHGSPVNIDRISVLATALAGNTDLIIKNGRIFGTIP